MLAHLKRGKPFSESPGYEYINNDDPGVKNKNVRNLINISTLKVYFREMYPTGVSSKFCEFLNFVIAMFPYFELGSTIRQLFLPTR